MKPLLFKLFVLCGSKMLMLKYECLCWTHCYRSCLFAVCGGFITGLTTGSIESPGYPYNYDNNANCTWTVQVTNGRTIAVSFEQFNIQGNTGSCTSDYIQVRPRVFYIMKNRDFEIGHGVLSIFHFHLELLLESLS